MNRDEFGVKVADAIIKIIEDDKEFSPEQEREADHLAPDPYGEKEARAERGQIGWAEAKAARAGFGKSPGRSHGYEFVDHPYASVEPRRDDSEDAVVIERAARQPNLVTIDRDSFNGYNTDAKALDQIAACFRTTRTTPEWLMRDIRRLVLLTGREV